MPTRAARRACPSLVRWAYTLLPNVQIGVELGIGGSLDERIVSTADLFANGLLPLGERRTSTQAFAAAAFRTGGPMMGPGSARSAHSSVSNGWSAPRSASMLAWRMPPRQGNPSAAG